jgi:toxin ParE1/3/4
MRQLRITLAASKDLQAISDYFLAQSIGAGDRFVQLFGQKCKYLARFPYIGKSYDHLRPNLRGLSVMGYIIFYLVNDDSIEIIRVISGYQNLENIFSEQ